MPSDPAGESPAPDRRVRGFVVFGFASTHDALDAESILVDAGFGPIPVPAPPDLSAHCGIALQLPIEQRSGAEIKLRESGIPAIRTLTTEAS